MAATSTEKTETSEQPSSEDVRQVIDEAEHVLAEGRRRGIRRSAISMPTLSGSHPKLESVPVRANAP